MADKKKPQIIEATEKIIEVIEKKHGIVLHIDQAPPRIEDVHPCITGRHRPAWLTSGGVACGICGVRL